jgi:hypothetical protein
MLRPLQAVILTYVARRSIWLILGFALLVTGPSIAMALMGKSAILNELLSTTTFSIGFPSGLAAFVLVFQAKWQICDPRARLLPGYMAPHLAVLAAIAVLILSALPLAIARGAGFGALGATACAITIAVPYIWAMHASNFLVGAIAFAAFYSLLTRPGAAFWLLPQHAVQFAPVHAALLVGGWAGFAGWLWRLAQLREEMPDYQIPTQAQAGSATRLERSSANRQIAQYLRTHASSRWLCDWWHDRLIGVRATSLELRMRLLRYGFAPIPAEVSALLMGAIFFAILFFLAKVSWMSNVNSPNKLFPMLIVLILLPSSKQGHLLAGRRARMSRELLLPLPRQRYIDGLLLVSAREAIVSWVVLHLVLVTLMAIVFPRMLTPRNVMAVTLMSLAAQVFMFGVQSWTARNPSGNARLIAAMVGIIPAMILVGLALGALEQDAPLLALIPTAVMAAAGAWINAGARHRWLIAELA